MMNHIVNGQVVELSQAEAFAIQAEWDAWDAAVAAAGGSASVEAEHQRDGAKRLYDRVQTDGRALRALARLMLDEINTLRSAAGLPPRTMAQARTAIRNAIDANS